jgi:hypothetical protein
MIRDVPTPRSAASGPATSSPAGDGGPAERPLIRLTRAVECGPAGCGVGGLLAG